MAINKKMSKRKLAIIITAVLSLLITLAATIGVIIAANIEDKKSGVTVEYTVKKNVSAFVSAALISGGNIEEGFEDMPHYTEHGSGLQINADDDKRTDKFKAPEIELTTLSPRVMLSFMFKNIDTETNKDMKITTINNSEGENIVVKYLETKQKGMLLDAVEEQGSTDIPEPMIVRPGETLYCYIYVEVDDLKLDAWYESTETAGLSFVLEVVE